MDIDHLKTSILHSKVAVFAIVGFLALVTVLIVIMARVSNEQALSNQSSASERSSSIRFGGQDGGYGGERAVMPSPALREAGKYNDIELKTADLSPKGGVSVQSCMLWPGRKCLPKNTCVPPNGTEVPGGGNCIANGSYIPDTVCCDQNANKDKGVTGEYDDYLILKESDCAKYGGQCKQGIDPGETSTNCPINLGLCSDDGFSTRGVCCLEKGGSNVPSPTGVVADNDCNSKGGSCIAYCSLDEYSKSGKCSTDGPKICGRDGLGNSKYIGECGREAGPDWKYACCRN